MKGLGRALCLGIGLRLGRAMQVLYTVPGVFEYRIMVGDLEYSYGLAVSYSDKMILSEWLVRIDAAGRETYLFNREVGDDNVSHAVSEADFINIDEKYKMDFCLEGFDENISETYRRKTMLNDIALRANDKEGIFAEIERVYEWFDNMIILFPDSEYGYIH